MCSNMVKEKLKAYTFCTGYNDWRQTGKYLN